MKLYVLFLAIVIHWPLFCMENDEETTLDIGIEGVKILMSIQNTNQNLQEKTKSFFTDGKLLSLAIINATPDDFTFHFQVPRHIYKSQENIPIFDQNQALNDQLQKFTKRLQQAYMRADVNLTEPARKNLDKGNTTCTAINTTSNEGFLIGKSTFTFAYLEDNLGSEEAQSIRNFTQNSEISPNTKKKILMRAKNLGQRISPKFKRKNSFKKDKKV